MVRVSISRRALLVEEGIDAKPIAEVMRGEVSSELKPHGQSGFLIAPLKKALVNVRERLEKLQRSGGKPFTGELMLVAHKETPYRLISEVCYSALLAGFRTYHIATMRPETTGGEARCIVAESPRYRSARLSKPPATHPKYPFTVVAEEKGFVLANDGSLLKGPNGDIPTLPKKGGTSSKHYPFVALSKMALGIKRARPARRSVFVSAARNVPWQIVVNTLDVLRGEAGSSKGCLLSDGCLFDRVVLSRGVQ